MYQFHKIYSYFLFTFRSRIPADDLSLIDINFDFPLPLREFKRLLIDIYNCISEAEKPRIYVFYFLKFFNSVILLESPGC